MRYEICHEWGNRLEFLDWPARKVSGHMSRIPEVGDTFEAKMKSGKTAVFRFIEIKRCWDPSDMFFATVEDVGYK